MDGNRYRGRDPPLADRRDREAAPIAARGASRALPRRRIVSTGRHDTEHAFVEAQAHFPVRITQPTQCLPAEIPLLPDADLRHPLTAARLFLFVVNYGRVHRGREPGLLRIEVCLGCDAGVWLTAGATQNYLDAKEGLVTVKSSISLNDEQHAFARALIEAGRWSSLSAVLQQGVDLLRQRMDAEELESAALRELLSRRRKGAFVGADGMDARLAGMVADKRRDHGLPS